MIDGYDGKYCENCTHYEVHIGEYPCVRCTNEIPHTHWKAKVSRIDDIGQNGGEGEHYDVVQKPRHYTQHPSGIECIQITEHMGFCLGNAMKYIWRAGLKDERKQDIEKAIWYLQRELDL